MVDVRVVGVKMQQLRVGMPMRVRCFLGFISTMNVLMMLIMLMQMFMLHRLVTVLMCMML